MNTQQLIERGKTAQKSLKRAYFTRVSATIMNGVTRNWSCTTRAELVKAINAAMRIGRVVKIDSFYS